MGYTPNELKQSKIMDNEKKSELESILKDLKEFKPTLDLVYSQVKDIDVNLIKSLNDKIKFNESEQLQLLKRVQFYASNFAMLHTQVDVNHFVSRFIEEFKLK